MTSDEIAFARAYYQFKMGWDPFEPLPSQYNLSEQHALLIARLVQKLFESERIKNATTKKPPFT